MIRGVQVPLSIASESRTLFTPRIRLERFRGRIGTEARWLWLAVLVFVAVSFWWLTQDTRVPIWDSGSHMTFAYFDGLALDKGQFSVPFTVYTTYPPLVHIVGAISVVLLGLHPMAMTMAANLVFVPLLGFGCYGVGKIVGGPRAGLLAGLFGLGTPMFVSMMHNFMIDAPQAAMVAVSLWAVLASRRFKRLGMSVLAGVLCGLAMLTKETSAVFLAGALLTVTARGGWRNWRGLVSFAVALGIIGGPWYVYHWSQISQTFTQIGQLYVNPLQSPPRWSIRSFGWYFWNLVNEQAILPFTLAFVAGTLIAIRRCVRKRLSSDSVLPELLVGGLVSYLGMTYLTHKDPRYTLPALVYVAVIGTFWIAGLQPGRRRTLLTGAIATVAVINFAGMSTGLGGTQRIMVALPGAQTNFLYPWQLTLYENQGWLWGGPEHDGDVSALLVGLHRMGISAVSVDPTASLPDFSWQGMLPLAYMADLVIDPAPPQTADSAYLLLHLPVRGDPAPCQRLSDGLGIYAVRGPVAGLNSQLLRDPASPKQQYSLICPGRAAISWPAARS
jgi:4-amino-4-deoxy-L-arabinose transferase-like glycosyltransferase